MVFVVAVLDVSDNVQTVGAFAGFAAILGLAVLSVLYFGQAREVKRLREWAGRAPERAAEMQDRVATDASRRVVAQPVTPARPTAAQPATPGAAAAARPAGAGAAGGAAGAGAAAAGTAAATPSGTSPPGAPATGAPGATKPPPADGHATGAKPADGTDQPTVLQPAVSGADAAKLAVAAGAPPPPSATPPTPTPPGAAAAGGGASSPPTSPQATPTGPATPAGGRAPAPAPAARPEPAVPLRSARASREAPAASAKAPSSSPTGATIAIIAAVGAILVAVVLVVTGVIGGDDEGDPARNVIVPTAPEPSTSTTGTSTPLNRAGVSVVVLNGTGVPNLAREASDKLGNDGYRLAAAGNRGDAAVTRTVVLFAPGNERAARDIVRLLKVGAVGELDAGTEVVAQPHAKPAGAKPEVVVTLGADAAQS